VLPFDDQLHLRRWSRSLPGRVHARLFGSAWEPFRRWHAHALASLVRRERPHICIIAKGVQLGPGDLRALKATGAWVANINHDDFFSAHRTNWSRAQRRALGDYDHLFTTREVNVAEVRPYNPRVEFFEFAWYPRIHRPVAIPWKERERWHADVVFVGNWEAERSRQLEQLVARVPSARYAIWGSGWQRAAQSLQPFVRGRQVILDEMAKAIGGAKMALGFLRRANRDDYTQRTFEIPACNGLLLAERTLRHQRYYREGEEAELFDPDVPEELAERVRRLLTDDQRRERLRAAGRAALLRQHHTYHDRMERLLEVYRARR
jgi:hypothetical protein